MKRLHSINNHRPLVKEAILHTCASCFINVSRHLETVKVLSLQPHTFIWFLLSGYPDEVLVFDTLLKLLSLKKGALVYHFSPQVNSLDISIWITLDGSTYWRWCSLNQRLTLHQIALNLPPVTDQGIEHPTRPWIDLF